MIAGAAKVGLHRPSSGWIWRVQRPWDVEYSVGTIPFIAAV
jgi:hypothetical protein